MNHKLYILGTALLTLFLSGCIEDEYVPCSSEILLELRTARASSPSTYAFDNADETKVNSVDVLVFLDMGGGNETFLYTTQAVPVSNVEGSRLKIFQVTDRKSVV